MEHLFSAQLHIDGKEEPYEIVFDKEQYLFQPADKSNPAFAFRREHDEWVCEGRIAAALQKSALKALEQYLMKQH